MNDDEDRLSALLLKWEEAWDLGEEIQAAELCVEHPELEQKLADQIKLLKSMNWMKQDEAYDELTDPDEADPLIGATLAGRYRIDSIVGFGGHGKVYKAFDPELQRHVAVKVSRSIASENQSDELLEEARRAAKLKHSNIVAVHDVGRHDGQLFFVTELVEGQNLTDLIANDRINPTEATRIVSALADALQFAHEQGFLHRDIKPENILLDHQGRVLVTDFGIATTIDKIEDHRGGTPGTLPYMAPEQISGQVQLIDGRTDIHALGVVLYELLTGELPYQGRTPTAVREQILLRQPKPLSTTGKRIPKHLEAICLKCLAKHPADRYSTATELASALTAPLPVKSSRLLAIVTSLIFLAISIWIWLGDAVPSSTGTDEGVLLFSGTNRIVTPLKRLSPVTLEAWVYPTSTDADCHFVIGSDIQGRFGIGLAICGSTLSAETVGRMVKSKSVVPPGEWSHIAAVFAEDETRLYLNGDLVHTGSATNPVDSNTTFVIGNVGLDTPIDYFEGRIRSVRISKGERYLADFLPVEKLLANDEGESTALLIFDGANIENQTILDLSGNGNDGRWSSFSR